MFGKTVAAVCIVICVIAGVWGWRWENGSEKKSGKKDDEQADRKRKDDDEQANEKAKNDK